MSARLQPWVRYSSSIRPFCPGQLYIRVVSLVRSLTLEQLLREYYINAIYTFSKITNLSIRNDKFLYMGGPLLAGVTVVALSSLAPMVLPLGLRGLAVAESISLYGGLAVFSGFVLYEWVICSSWFQFLSADLFHYSTQKILQHGRLAAAGAIPRDPMKESVSLQLDFMNIL